MAVLATGCGSRPGTLTLPHSLSPQSVQKRILAQMQKWRETSAVVKDQVQIQGLPSQTYNLHLSTRTSPDAAAAQVTSASHPTVTLVDTSQYIVWEKANASHYLVFSQWPAQSDHIRIMGMALRTMLKKAKVASVEGSPTTAGLVTLQFPTKLPGGQAVEATLQYNLTAGVPVKFEATWSNGRIVETASAFRVNPPLSGTFQFVPDPGVTPEVAMGPGKDIYHPASAVSNFPVILPPDITNATLQDVHFTKGGGKKGAANAIVILTYTAADGSPLVVTERPARARVSPPSINLTHSLMGHLGVRWGPLPLSKEFAEFTEGPVLVWVEGESSAVDRFVSDWGSLTPPSASPSSPTSPSPSPPSADRSSNTKKG